MSLPPQCRNRLHSISPLECLHGEIKRSTGVVGIFPSADAIARLGGAVTMIFVLAAELHSNDAAARGWLVTKGTLAAYAGVVACRLRAVAPRRRLLVLG